MLLLPELRFSLMLFAMLRCYDYREPAFIAIFMPMTWPPDYATLRFRHLIHAMPCLLMIFADIFIYITLYLMPALLPRCADDYAIAASDIYARGCCHLLLWCAIDATPLIWWLLMMPCHADAALRWCNADTCAITPQRYAITPLIFHLLRHIFSLSFTMILTLMPLPAYIYIFIDYLFRFITPFSAYYAAIDTDGFHFRPLHYDVPISSILLIYWYFCRLLIDASRPAATAISATTMRRWAWVEDTIEYAITNMMPLLRH